MNAQSTESKTESKTENANDIECTDDEKQSNKDRNEVNKEGFLELETKTLFIGKFRKRFVCLNNNHLQCYKSEQKIELTENIDLGLYKMAQSSNTKMTQFELIPMSKNDKIRVFSADTVSETQEWIKYINLSMNALATLDKNELRQKQKGLYTFMFCGFYNAFILCICVRKRILFWERTRLLDRIQRFVCKKAE